MLVSPAVVRSVAVVTALAAAACARESIDAEALRDPASCAACHPDHTREWAASMHAYASDDPVFLALERLGQRDTGGLLGEFCVRCHAPAALRDGRTRADLDLANLPREERGVGCWACHAITDVVALHNGGLERADDGVVRGRGLPDPLHTPAHASAGSRWLDGRGAASSDACGACHDVVTPGGLAVERTYAEWAESLFGPASPRPVSCATCHMISRTGLAANVPDAPLRRVHDHGFPGVDQALTPWPGRAEQDAAIDRDLRASLSSLLCVRPGPRGVEVAVTLDNLQVGHAFPSGVTHARRLWVEVRVEAGGAVALHTGRFAPGEVVSTETDPDLWLLRSRFLDADGAEVKHAWEAHQLESELLPAAVTADPSDPRFYHALTRRWDVAGAVDRVEIAVHLEAVGLELLDHLIEAGELDPAIRDAMPRRTLPSLALTWTLDRGWGCVP